MASWSNVDEIEIKQLKASITELEAALRAALRGMEAAVVSMDEFGKRVTELERALYRYGTHGPGCEISSSSGGCECGWSKVVSSLSR